MYRPDDADQLATPPSSASSDESGPPSPPSPSDNDDVVRPGTEDDGSYTPRDSSAHATSDGSLRAAAAMELAIAAGPRRARRLELGTWRRHLYSV